MSTSLSAGVSKRNNGKSKVSTSAVQRKDLDLVSRVYQSGSFCPYNFEIEPFSGSVWLIFHYPVSGRYNLETDDQGKRIKNKRDIRKPIKIGSIRNGVWQAIPGAYTNEQLQNCIRFVMSEKVIAKTTESYQPLADDSVRFPRREVRRIPKFVTR